jgi:DNA-binding transcriptional LysR family regulator
MLSNLSVKHLRAFVALATHRNFTRAAQACHLSQSAFSALIQTLEEQAGCRLFERTTRHVDLSTDGRRFEEMARRLLGDFEAAFDDLRDHAERRKGRVAIAALPSLAGGDLPPLLANFHQQYPGIALELHDQLADGCIELVRRGQADFALAPAPAQDADLRVEALVRDSFHLACPADHPLAGKRRYASPGRTAIHPAVAHQQREAAPGCSTASAQAERVMEVEHLATVAALVEAGLGVSVVPALALFQFRREGWPSGPCRCPRWCATSAWYDSRIGRFGGNRDAGVPARALRSGRR